MTDKPEEFQKDDVEKSIESEAKPAEKTEEIKIDAKESLVLGIAYGALLGFMGSITSNFVLEALETIPFIRSMYQIAGAIGFLLIIILLVRFLKNLTKKEENIRTPQKSIIISTTAIIITIILFLVGQWFSYCSGEKNRQGLLDSLIQENDANLVTISHWERDRNKIVNSEEWFIERISIVSMEESIKSGRIGNYTVKGMFRDTYMFMDRVNRKWDFLNEPIFITSTEMKESLMERKKEYNRSISYDTDRIRDNLIKLNPILENIRYYPNPICPCFIFGDI